MTLFFRGFESYGDRPAVRDDSGHEMSFRELADASDQVAEEYGPPQSVVAIESANSVESVVAYLGALRSDCVALLADATLGSNVREALYARFAVSVVVSGAPGQGGRPSVRRRSESHKAHDGLALLLSTSGSTGSPKLVRLSARSVDANAESIAEYLSLTAEERPLASLPLHYSYGLSVLNSHLRVGATVTLTEEPVTSRAFWSLVAEHELTSLCGVPSIWETLRRLKVARMPLPSLTYATQAGGRLSMDTTRHFADWATETGRRFVVMYGQTEATARMSYVPPSRLMEKLGSIGVPIPGGTFTLTDAGGATVDHPDEVGEIEYRGPNVMWGYAESAEDLQRGDDCEGVLKTGDLARADSDGFFFLEGRTKRIAKVFGNRVNLDEVEELLLQRGIVAAVSEVDDRLLIGIEDAPAQRALQIVRDRLRIHPSGVRVLEIPEIPRNAAGKVLYPELLQLFPPPTDRS